MIFPRNFVQHRQHRTAVTYKHMFEYADRIGSGFCFDCNEDGSNVVLKGDDAKSNYSMCVSGCSPSGKVIIDKGIQKCEWSWVEPAIIVCCGDYLHLDKFTNTCACCGDDYNMSGDLLAPREQWGDDTGELVSDITMADTKPWDY